MDFAFSEEQQALADLAAQILGDQSTHERLKELEASATTYFDREPVGGARQGRPARHRAARGRRRRRPRLPRGLRWSSSRSAARSRRSRTSPRRARRRCRSPSSAPTSSARRCCPASSTASGPHRGARPRPAPARCAADDRRRRRRRLAARRREGLRARRRRSPTASLVPAPRRPTDVVICSSSTSTGAGVTRERQDTNHGPARGALTLDGVEVAADDVARARPTGRRDPRLDRRARDRRAVRDRHRRLRGGPAHHRRVHQDPRAVRPADRHVPGRRPARGRRLHRHRGHPAHRLAGRLAPARGPARRPSEVAIAKFWGAEGGQRVVHAAQHLHGGIGVDLDYPLHRYFLWAKQLELTLGGATHSCSSLGKILADEPV